MLAASALLVYTSVKVYGLRSGYAQGTQDQEIWWWLLVPATISLRLVFPLLIVGSVGASIGEDRRSGLTDLVSVRSARPLASFLAHLAASLVSAATVAAVPLALAGLLAWIVGPREVTGFFARPQPGFPSSPFLLGILPASVFAAEAMLAVALAGLVGLFTTNLFAIVGSASLLMLLPASMNLPGSEVLDPSSAFLGARSVASSLAAIGIMTVAVAFMATAVVQRRGGVP